MQIIPHLRDSAQKEVREVRNKRGRWAWEGQGGRSRVWVYGGKRGRQRRRRRRSRRAMGGAGQAAGSPPKREVVGGHEEWGVRGVGDTRSGSGRR
jgi:hypothetical protein